MIRSTANQAEKTDSRCRIERSLMDAHLEFDHAYVQVKSLGNSIEQTPDTLSEQTINALVSILCSDRYQEQKQVYFLFRETADLLIDLAVQKMVTHAGDIVSRLQDILLSSREKRRRAVSEALGTLPVTITGPDITLSDDIPILDLRFKEFLAAVNRPDIRTFTWHGRTLRYTGRKNTIGCIKFATSPENISLLDNETKWLWFLKKNLSGIENKCHVPDPVSIGRFTMFRFRDLPPALRKGNPAVVDSPAIAYTTIPGYYAYPNDGLDPRQAPEKIKGILWRNALLLGLLTSKGIIHTALIPLFHNRVQQSRRDDQGHYLWEHGGRLDQWLDSCRYPNFAESGLRDFEHLVSIKAPGRLRHFIGEHILGFFLVTGSIFRNLEPGKKGWDQNGNPVNLCHLFDADFFYTVMKGIIENYFAAMTGILPDRRSQILLKDLIAKLIPAMGIDEHMEETLRIEDQNNMGEEEFYRFLKARGIGAEESGIPKKGKEDIVLTSGPHLGGFNRPISVPDLTEFLFVLSAICISDRYLKENRLKGPVNYDISGSFFVD